MIISVVSVQIAWLLGLHRVTDDEWRLRELETLSIVPDVELHEYSDPKKQMQIMFEHLGLSNILTVSTPTCLLNSLES